MKSCVFCGIELTKNNRSREHVIPRWVQEVRGLSAEILSAGFGDAISVTIERRMDMNSFLAGQVCARCNNGWMNELENHTRDLLVRLLGAKVEPEALSEEESLQLAKWTVKTAIACNSALGKEPRIDARFIRQFDRGRSENLGTCGVFAGSLDIPNKFGYIQTTASNPMLVGSEPAEVRVGLYLDGFILITVVVPSEGLGYTFELVEGIHRPVWPGRGHEFRKDRNTSSLSGTETDLKVVIDSLRVRYRFDLS